MTGLVFGLLVIVLLAVSVLVLTGLSQVVQRRGVAVGRPRPRASGTPADVLFRRHPARPVGGVVPERPAEHRQSGEPEGAAPESRDAVVREAGEPSPATIWPAPPPAADERTLQPQARSVPPRRPLGERSVARLRPPAASAVARLRPPAASAVARLRPSTEAAITRLRPSVSAAAVRSRRTAQGLRRAGALTSRRAQVVAVTTAGLTRRGAIAVADRLTAEPGRDDGRPVPRHRA